MREIWNIRLEEKLGEWSFGGVFKMRDIVCDAVVSKYITRP